MLISKSSPRRPRQRVTSLDANLSPRPKDTSPAPFAPGGGRRPPSQKILDAIAEETIHKGYTGPRHPTCVRCHLRKSSNGACGC